MQQVALTSKAPIARSFTARVPSARRVRPAVIVPHAQKGLPKLEVAVGKVAVSAALAALLALGGPAHAKLNTDTRKAGEGALIEYSQIGDESPASVVQKLKDMVPKIQERLAADASELGSGSGYPDSIVKEFNTVKSEIDALEQQVAQAGADNGSSVKSMASGIEQQVNALKAILGFD